MFFSILYYILDPRVSNNLCTDYVHGTSILLYLVKCCIVQYNMLLLYLVKYCIV